MKKRFRFLKIAIACIVTITIVFPLMSFAYFPDVDETADQVKAEIEQEIQYKSTIEGNIVDSDGEIIYYATEPGRSGTVDFEAYFNLIGYNERLFGSSGLRHRYSDALKLDTGKDNIGATLKLTTINELQCAAYDIIKGQDASVVVLDNKTGRILALASSNSGYELDVNNVSAETLAMANAHEGSLVPAWKVVLAPGSVMKPVLAVPTIEHNWHKDVYYDNGSVFVGNTLFNNFNGIHYNKVGLEEALGYSINTYFIDVGRKLGSYGVRNICERFLIGKDIELDFTTIQSSHGINDTSLANVAATSFGQGKLLISSLHLAMIASSIANEGVMLKPYLIDSITSDDKITYEGTTTELTQVAEKDTMAELFNILQITAAEYYDIPKSYGIAAKTGTAELGHSIDSGSGQNRATFLSCNKDYTVVISSHFTNKFGGNFQEDALHLYDLLENRKNANIEGD